MEFVSWDDEIPYGEIKHVPNHQPDQHTLAYGSKMIQSYLLRKWDRGMIWRVICTFSDSVWIHRAKF